MSLSFNPLYQLTVSRLREFLREPEALFWVFIFPVLLTVGLGIAFRSQPAAAIPVAVQDGAGAASTLAALADDERIEARILSAEEAEHELRTGRVALVAIPEGTAWTYWFDPTRPDSRMAEMTVDTILQGAAGREDAFTPQVRSMKEKGSRYIDFLVPGLLGMNLMSTGMFGVGFSIVNARSKRLLKRLIATPMRKSHYMVAQLGGRLIFLFGEVVVLVSFAHFFFEVPIRGSLFALTVVSLLAASTFSGLGLLVASRAETLEGVSGLMNFVMLPMWLMSGIFFSTSRFPDAIQPVVQALPLTAVNDALRAVMLEGSSLAGIAGELAIIGVWCLICYAGSVVLFRWM